MYWQRKRCGKETEAMGIELKEITERRLRKRYYFASPFKVRCSSWNWIRNGILRRDDWDHGDGRENDAL